MSDKAQATWGGRFSEAPADLMVRFSESVSFDKRLAPFDVQGSIAQAKMLASIGIISATEAEEIVNGLNEILEEVKAGQFNWDIRLEDVHMNIEQALTKRVPAAAKLHTGRSRNDQVATDMRLFFKHAAGELDAALTTVIATIIDKAEETKKVHIPGYTHLQRAQPVSMAHHLLAYVEMFARDRDRITDFQRRANVCPLGSGAIAGSTLPLDRAFTAKALDFTNPDGSPRMTTNSMDAVADRDLFIEFANICAIIATHLSRIAEDLIIWNTTEFAFIDLPDAFTTGSSLMPQKKNPDSLELIRGKSALIMGIVPTMLTLVKGLPLTYNRDLQEDKPPIFDALDWTIDCLKVLEGTIKGMNARPEKCRKAVDDPMLLATDLVDYLVNKGLPFRDAHHVVGHLVGMAESENCPLNQLPLKKVQSVSPLLEADWVSVFDLEAAMRKRNNTGMPGAEMINAQISRWRASLS